MNSVVAEVTQRIKARSRASRETYLRRMERAQAQSAERWSLSCGNLAHGMAACSAEDRAALKKRDIPNIAIVSAYNDVLSAHQPYARYPDLIKNAVREVHGVAQVAGGVPAMCDGVTQGQVGMELSLFSRDIIAMATAVALSHGSFDGVLCLGICDKIVPGLFMGASAFGYLPVIFVPSGPMPSGLSNKEKIHVRQEYAQGRVDAQGLLDAECRAYHAPGTCTFYGTANTNQMIMEFMGLHLPGASFVPPDTPLRDGLTRSAAQRIVGMTALTEGYLPFVRIVDERAVVNAMIALVATGGSTNHLIHLPAMARAAGIHLTWDDFSQLSRVVPLVTRIYPNGSADINAFHQAGGTTALMGILLDAGLLHEDVETIVGHGLGRYREEPSRAGDGVTWRMRTRGSSDAALIAPVSAPFAPEGGIKVLQGNLGRAIMKVSAVAPEHRRVEAPARVFDRQDGVLDAFKRGELNRDVVVVLRFQGPRANGMPELHQLSPALGALQDQGFHVALVTDGRMSGASGKFPAAIHVTPECMSDGALARVEDGDVVRLDGEQGQLDVLLDAVTLADRMVCRPPLEGWGLGRELFAWMRHGVSDAENGATVVPHIEASP